MNDKDRFVQYFAYLNKRKVFQAVNLRKKSQTINQKVQKLSVCTKPFAFGLTNLR